ncbi:unnamed protein product [Orchesella dallaii]|uniref:AB hydrolase-1 domain-containing protein n=1 Tax=Orchesella dallaii TaxID=48710 RepID=A0ABP1PJJ9_9HEXA
MGSTAHFWRLCSFLLLIGLCGRENCQALFGTRKCAPFRQNNFINTILSLSSTECRESVKQNPFRLTKRRKKLSTIQELQSQGFVASIHTILSKDGYYSTIIRISGSLRSPPKLGKQAVLLLHGLGARGESWMIQPGNRNLAFILANGGYEVWLANLRGSTQSLNHTRFNAKLNLSYWNFGFEEIAIFDLPQFVDLILKETGTDKLHLACHSSGCTIYLVGLSEFPELNDKFKSSFLLAPAAYLGHGYGPIAKLAVIIGTPLEQILFKLFGGRVTSETQGLARALGFKGLHNFCEWSAIRCGLCERFHFAMFGADAPQFNYSDIANMVAKSQDNTGWKQLVHFGQNLLACGFNKYDFGRKRNLELYGMENPPQYELGRLKVPTYIFYGEADNFITPRDLAKTRDAIPSTYMKGFHRVDWPLFNHVDFLMAKDADVLVYNKILRTLNSLDSNS